nr:hypothetical protein [Pseudoerythrocladia kornmannii]
MLSNLTPSLNMIIIIFILGILTSLNPCSISIIPIYLSYITNVELEKRILTNIFFILGSCINFLLIGEAAISITSFYNKILVNSDLTTGVALVFIGIVLLRLIPLDIIVQKNQNNSPTKSNFLLSAFFLGSSSGFVTSACNIPVIIALLSWLSIFSNPLQSVFLLLVYFLGYSLSLVFISILSNIMDQIGFLNNILSWITSLFGMFLLSNGIFLICTFIQL